MHIAQGSDGKRVSKGIFFGTEVLLAQKLVDCPRKWLIGVQYVVQDVHRKSPKQKIATRKSKGVSWSECP